MYGKLNQRQWTDWRTGDGIPCLRVKEALVAGTVQRPILLIEHCAREMGADIAIRDQAVARQIDQNALRVFIGIIEDLPFVLGQFAHPGNRNG